MYKIVNILTALNWAYLGILRQFLTSLAKEEGRGKCMCVKHSVMSSARPGVLEGGWSDYMCGENGGKSVVRD